MNLNDIHHWTRERIAAWVMLFEPPPDLSRALPAPVEVEVHTPSPVVLAGRA